jgi:hypothetical protein
VTCLFYIDKLKHDEALSMKKIESSGISSDCGAIIKINHNLHRAIYHLGVYIVASKTDKTEEDSSCYLKIILKNI